MTYTITDLKNLVDSDEFKEFHEQDKINIINEEQEYLKDIVRKFVNFKGVDLMTVEEFEAEKVMRNKMKGRKFKLGVASIKREGLGTRFEYYSSHVYNLPSFFEIITLEDEKIYFKKSLIQPKEKKEKVSKKKKIPKIMVKTPTKKKTLSKKGNQELKELVEEKTTEINLDADTPPTFISNITGNEELEPTVYCIHCGGWVTDENHYSEYDEQTDRDYFMCGIHNKVLTDVIPEEGELDNI